MSNPFNNFCIVDIERNWSIRIECFKKEYPDNKDWVGKQTQDINFITINFGYLWKA